MVNLNSIVTKELRKLCLRYRKDFTDEKLLDMAEGTAHNLKYVPGDKMPEVFDRAAVNSKYFPDDFKLLKAWGEIKGTKKANGFYDCWGIWFRDGTYYNWMTRPAPEWIISCDVREWELILRNRLQCLRDEDIEDWEVLKNKKYDVVKGQIQKPRREWSIDDNSFQDNFNSDYEDLRNKYNGIEKQILN